MKHVCGTQRGRRTGAGLVSAQPQCHEEALQLCGQPVIRFGWGRGKEGVELGREGREGSSLCNGWDPPVAFTAESNAPAQAGQPNMGRLDFLPTY